MFNWINPKIALLQQRVRDLELSNERLITQYSDAQENLLRLQNEKDKLQDLLFNTVGIIKVPVERKPTPQPISMGKTVNWQKKKEELENNSMKQYWDNKNKETEKANIAAQIAEQEKNIGLNETENVG